MIITMGAVVFMCGFCIIIHTEFYMILIDKKGCRRQYYWSRTLPIEARHLCGRSIMFANKRTYLNYYKSSQLPSLVYNRHFRVNMYVTCADLILMTDMYNGMEL